VTVTLTALRREDLVLIVDWFEDAETRRYVGGPDWPSRMLARQSAVGSMFRGEQLLRTYRWLARIDDLPVGYVDCGVTDCWTTCAAPDEAGEPLVLHSLEGPACSIVVVVDPKIRGRGVGHQILRALLHEPTLHEVRVFGAGIEPDNLASRRCFERVGFRLHDAAPDWEGIIYYLLTTE
jgi:RimJ/RimL family protein N-acetyltransferase